MIQSRHLSGLEASGLTGSSLGREQDSIVYSLLSEKSGANKSQLRNESEISCW